MTWLVDVVLLAVGVLLTRLFSGIVRARRARAEARGLATIANAGLIVNGDVLGTFDVRGHVDGIAVEITSGAPLRRPGVADETSTACVVWVPVPLPDQIVCKVSEVDQIMGPVPAVPRVRTGNEMFDDGYAVFVGPAGEAANMSYRAPPDRTRTPWAQAPILHGLLDLELLWLRVQEGYAEIAFPPLEAEDVVRAAALSAALRGAASGRTAAGIPRCTRLRRPPLDNEVIEAGLVWGGCTFLALTCGVPLVMWHSGTTSETPSPDHLAVALLMGLSLVVIGLGTLGWLTWRSSSQAL